MTEREGAGPPRDTKGVISLIAQIASIIIAGTALIVTLMKDDRTEREKMVERMTVIECRLKIADGCK